MTVSVEEFFTRAIASFQAGRLEDAERCFTEVLQYDPKHIAALNLLGILLTHVKRYSEAERVLRSALNINSKSDVTFYNYGIVLKALTRPSEALERFTQALAINPVVAETWNNRGTVFNDLKRYIDAISDFDQAVALNPNYSEAFCNKGNSCGKLKRYNEALAAYDKALALRPDLADAWLGRGNVFTELKRRDEAFAAYDKALALKPDLADAWLGRGNVYNELRRYDDAFAAYDKALALKPDLAEVWLGRGNVYNELGRYDDAFAAYDKALALKPDLADAWLGRGNVYNEFGRYDDAFAAYDEALALKPDLAEAWLGRGLAFFRLNLDAEALECYEKSLALKQDLPQAQWNKALLKLSRGEYEEGWKLYEWKSKTKYFTSSFRQFTQPLWLDDSNITAKTILVHAEQGLGDTIQFSRYLNLLKDKECKIVFEIQKPLSSLFKSLNWQCDVVAQGELIPWFDLHCPLISLPLAFKTRIETIPANVPYICAHKDKKIEWANRLGAASKVRIGLAWSGNPYFARGNDISRPIPLSVLAAVISDNFEWYRLQKDLRESDKQALSELPAIKDFSGLFEDFSDTAALIEELDLVISVDTAVAHLAGAMGKPVWILLPFHPDFRWLRERTDSPWYPTARLYRQKKDGDWTDVLECVSADLKSSLA